MTNRAIHHAMAAGDEDATAGLVARAARTVFAAGHGDTVRGWLSWFEEEGHSARYPAIALLAVMVYASIGDVAVTQRHAAVVFEQADQPSGPLVPMAKIARGLLCPAGIAQVHRDGLEAREALTPASEWYPAALSIEGIGLLWSGDTNAADANFALAAEMGERFSAAPASVFTLATRSAIASERAEYDEASTLASHALRLVRQLGMERYATSVLSFVVAARAMRRRGDPAEARRLLNQASALRPLLTVALPVVSVQTLLEMAEARLEFGDAGGARQMLREVADILHERPGLGGLEDRFTTLREQLAEVPAVRSAASTLTNAELRLLPFLVTHLSFPEIGERLYISRHTVKTQAMSIYRKLGSSSRSEAVQVAREMHLLDV